MQKKYVKWDTIWP